MNVDHFGGRIVVDDAAALDEVLASRYGDDVNEFWICGTAPYPLLSIQVRGAQACLHYYPYRDHPGLISVGPQDTSRSVVFSTNTPHEQIHVAASAVVPFARARQAAHEFLLDAAKPSAVRWFEL